MDRAAQYHSFHLQQGSRCECRQRNMDDSEFRLSGAALLALLTCAKVAAAEPESAFVDCLLVPNQLVEVSSSEVGVLAQVHVDTSDRVTEGQLLAELDTKVERAALALSEARAAMTAEIDRLRRSQAFNTRRVARNDELHARRALPDQVMDETRTELELAALRLREAQENKAITRLELERARAALERRYIRSPIDGVVVTRHKAGGEYVEGDPIVQLAQINPLRVDLVAPISMLTQIKVGMRALISSELADAAPIEATVTRIDPIIDAATATFGIRLTMPNDDRAIPPGLRCRAELVAEE